MNVLDLFSGIGGFSLGLERAGMKTVAFCEIEPYPQAVLRKNFPGVPIYDDVRTVTAERLRADGIGRIDVITGGFPCQDLSLAGALRGIEGERSGLWREVHRLISEIRPEYAIMENVTNLLAGESGRWFGRVLRDLAQVGYDAEWHCIPASALGASHHRDRVWILAYPNQIRREQGLPVERKSKQGGAILNNNGFLSGKQYIEKTQGWTARIGETIAPTESGVGRTAHGVPEASHRIAALGNSVIPQIPEIIGRAIMQIEGEATCN